MDTQASHSLRESHVWGSAVVILNSLKKKKRLFILSLNLCFEREVQWCDGTCAEARSVGSLPPCDVPPSLGQVLAMLCPVSPSVAVSHPNIYSYSQYLHTGFLCEYQFSLLYGKYPNRVLLTHMVGVCLTSLETANLFSGADV